MVVSVGLLVRLPFYNVLRRWYSTKPKSLILPLPADTPTPSQGTREATAKKNHVNGPPRFPLCAVEGMRRKEPFAPGIDRVHFPPQPQCLGGGANPFAYHSPSCLFSLPLGSGLSDGVGLSVEWTHRPSALFSKLRSPLATRWGTGCDSEPAGSTLRIAGSCSAWFVIAS